MNKFLAIVSFSLLALVLGGCQAPTMRYSSVERWQGGTSDTGASISTGFGFETGRDHSQRFYAEKQRQLGTHVYSETYYSRPIKGGPVIESTISQGEEVKYHINGTRRAPWDPKHPWNQGRTGGGEQGLDW